MVMVKKRDCTPDQDYGGVGEFDGFSVFLEDYD